MNSPVSRPVFADAAKGKTLWSLRTGEVAFHDRGGSGFHSFAMAVDESGKKPVISEELHFLPLLRISDGTFRRSTSEGADNPEMLGATVYRKTDRNLETLPNVTYVTGSSAHIQSLWNQACRMALVIADLQRPFSDNHNCRAGIKAVIERLGYTFKTFADPKTQRGLTSNLNAEIGAIPGPTFPDPLAEYGILRQRLTLVRQPSGPAAAGPAMFR